MVFKAGLRIYLHSDYYGVVHFHEEEGNFSGLCMSTLIGFAIWVGFFYPVFGEFFSHHRHHRPHAPIMPPRGRTPYPST